MTSNKKAKVKPMYDIPLLYDLYQDLRSKMEDFEKQLDKLNVQSNN